MLEVLFSFFAGTAVGAVLVLAVRAAGSRKRHGKKYGFQKADRKRLSADPALLGPGRDEHASKEFDS